MARQLKRKRKNFNRLGSVQQKVLLLLLGGAALAFVRTPSGYRRLVQEVTREWQKINQRSLQRAVAALYRSKLVVEHEHPDGSTTIVLSDQGKERALTFNINTITVKKPARWDKKWRVVIFDIPEKQKKAREALRAVLKRMGFHKLQKSVFVCPYPYWDEIEYVIEFFRLRPYIRMLTVESVDNELHLREIFEL